MMFNGEKFTWNERVTGDTAMEFEFAIEEMVKEIEKEVQYITDNEDLEVYVSGSSRVSESQYIEVCDEEADFCYQFTVRNHTNKHDRNNDEVRISRYRDMNELRKAIRDMAITLSTEKTDPKKIIADHR